MNNPSASVTIPDRRDLNRHRDPDVLIYCSIGISTMTVMATLHSRIDKDERITPCLLDKQRVGSRGSSHLQFLTFVFIKGHGLRFSASRFWQCAKYL